MKFSRRLTVVLSVLALLSLGGLWVEQRFAPTSLTSPSKPAVESSRTSLTPDQHPLELAGQTSPTPSTTSSMVAGRYALTAWTLTSPSEGPDFSVQSVAAQIARWQGKPAKGRSATMVSPTREQLQALRSGDRLQVPFLDGSSRAAAVTQVHQDHDGNVIVSATFSDHHRDTLVLSHNGKNASAVALLYSEGRALEVEKQRDGQLILHEKHLSEVLCFPLPRPRNDPRANSPSDRSRIQANPPSLSSRPEARAVIYLDFDGESVSDPFWSAGTTIHAAAPDLTEAQIIQIWNHVKEDFAPFNIDVTTIASRYNEAPVNRRTRCIITPTDAASEGAGGVARLYSFSRAGTGTYSSTIPCWVFNTTVKGIAEAISHEVGHTLGLQHDGRLIPVEEYYEGHGTGDLSWAPIMGSGYEKNLTQWSKGEYAQANQQEDDLALITSSVNGFGYSEDEAGATRSSAASLRAVDGIINQTGVIARSADIDFYAMNVPAGRIIVNASPASVAPNLDLSLELQDASGVVLASSNPEANASANLSLTVLPGTYFLRVAGSGRGDPLGTGYTAYGSIGQYRLSGTLPAPLQAPVITSLSSVSGVVGQAFTYTLSADQQPTRYEITAGTLPLGLSLTSATGVVSGTPTSASVSSVTFAAVNSVGIGTKTVTFTFSGPRSLEEALDHPGLVWTATGNSSWFAQTATTHDGVDAAQSGSISANQSSALQTTVTGPATLSFRWKTDSEEGYDLVQFSINGVARSSLSGSTAWMSESHNLPAGTHTLEWRYSKDGNVSEGQDAAWVDALSVTEPQLPVISSSSAAAGSVSQPFVYQLTATNSPTRYAVVSGNLPPGLTLNVTTGVISGTPGMVGVYSVLLGATNAAGTSTLEVIFSISPSSISLETALDTTELTWTTGGNLPWSGQTSITYDSVDAARSGAIGNSQSSWMETSVTGPAILTFRWRIDSEEGYDVLTVRDNGALVASISGLRDWTEQVVNVGPGSHAIRWTYTKDITRSVGADAAWVDAVTLSRNIVRVLTLAGDLAFGQVPVGATASRTLTLSNTGNAPLTIESINLPPGFSSSASGTIPPGGSLATTIVFTPTQVISYGGNVTVVSDATSGVSSRSISGSGAPAAPANDGFGSAIQLAGTTIRTTANTESASRELGEPRHDNLTGGKSIWWRWTAPASGPVSVNTIGSEFDTLLAIYRGDSLTALTPIASDDENGGDGTSALTFNATQGATYFIAVDGFLGDAGNVVLNVAMYPLIPANDLFSTPIILTGTHAQSVASTAAAGREAGEPSHGNLTSGKSLWWSWTAPFSGRLLLNTNGSSFNTVLCVYTGTSVSSLTLLASDDQSGYGDASSLALSVVAGTTYRIVIDGTNNALAVAVLSLRLVVPPANDNLANAQLLTGPNVRITGTSLGATKEEGEPNHYTPSTGGASVWYRWLAPTTGRVALTTEGSRFDTILAAYTPNSANRLVGIAANDEAALGTMTSAIDFAVTAGTGYWFVVEGYQGASGDISLALSYRTRPPNDNFSQGIVLLGANTQTTGDNFGAIKEAGEPNHAGFAGGRSLWWRWTAPATSRVSLSTAGSNFDTLLAVYTGTAVNALTLVAANDQDSTGTGTSALSFNAVAGTTYHIAVDGYRDAPGRISLRLTSVLLTAPAITNPPQSLTVVSGQTAIFAVTATGTAPLSYQWKKDGINVPGATGSTLTLSNTQLSSAGVYTVTVTNGSGSITSQAATLTVTPLESPPILLTHPADIRVAVGQSATFTVTASSPTSLTYQWRENGIAIRGATSSTLTLNNLQIFNSANYSVVVSNAYGSVTSNNARLTVTPQPIIQVQPMSQSVALGEAVLLSVSASGSGTLTYQWLKNGVIITGATQPLLSLPTPKVEDSGNYTVIVTDANGSVTSAVATLNVLTALPPSLLTQPQSVSASEGSSVSFSVTARGSGTLVYRWYFVPPGIDPPPSTPPLSGATLPTLTLPSVTQAQVGLYYVRVSNDVGEVTSNSAFLTVTSVPQPPVISKQPPNQRIKVGASLALSVEVTGTAPFTFQWKKQGVPIPGATSSTLTIGAAQTTDTGDYTVTVNNSVGSVTSSVVNVTVEPVLASWIANVSVRTTLDAEQTVIVGVNVSGAARPLVIRAIGPGLKEFGVADAMKDPRLSFYDGQTLSRSNDNWGGSADLAQLFASVGAFAVPLDSLDAAISESVTGSRSVHVSGRERGNVLVEAYDAGSGSEGRLTNVSARNVVGTGADILVAGFVIQGTGPKTVLLRAIGPGLKPFGVSQPLDDPLLEVYSGDTKIAENNNWASALSTTFLEVGAFGLPTESKDAALQLTLQPGPYTVQVRGADGGTGDALIEVYEVAP